MAIGPAFSQDAGDILIISTAQETASGTDATDEDDALEWVRQGTATGDGSTTIVIEVTDDDLNVATTTSQTFTVGEDDNGLIFRRVALAPFAGASISGAGLTINDTDTTGDISVTVFGVSSQADGAFSVNVKKLTTTSAGTFTLTYKGAETNNTDTLDDDKQVVQLVTVSSNDQDVSLTLTESGVDSGVFRAAVNLVPPGTADDGIGNPELAVAANNDEITATYNDEDPDESVSYSVDVETIAPIVADHSPADGEISENTRPDFEANITDSGSGVDEDEVTLVVAKVSGAGGDKPVTQSVHINTTPRVDEIDDGQAVRESISGTFAQVDNADVTYYWWYVAKDTAGNVGVSDQEPTTSDGVDDSCDADAFDADATMSVSWRSEVADGDYEGCDGFSYKVDVTDPRLVNARTGAWWDSDLDDGDGATEDDANKARDTSIQVVFSEDLDESSVQTTDFEVDGNEPLSVEVQGSNVFLTVPQLDPDEEPEVKLVSTVSDIAGRQERSGTIDEARDGIAASLDVSIAGTALSGDRPVTDDKVTITVSTNEKVSQPQYTFWEVMNVSTSDGYSPSTGNTGVIPFKEGSTYEVEVKLPSKGLFSIRVFATDSNNSENVASVGANHAPVTDDPDTEDDVEMRTAFEDVEDALLIEKDTDVAGGSTKGLALDPSKSAGEEDANMFSSDDPNLFISIDLSAEGSEYPIKDGTPGDDEAQATSDQDTYGAVTITSATLDGDDISDMLLPNTAGNVFLYKASGLALGEHDIEVEATDAAGNDREFEGTVTITERKPYSLGLTPGWNLVSIPGDPANTDINSVIPADHPASRVHSYDPMVPGLWLTAIRGADGSFSGTLTDITAGRAYLIETDSSAPISIDIPRADATSVPPVIVLSEGWNMVPVLDPTGKADQNEDQRGVEDYLGDAKVSRIYGYSSISGALIEESTADGELEVGAGYWVYVTEESAITP